MFKSNLEERRALESSYQNRSNTDTAIAQAAMAGGSLPELLQTMDTDKDRAVIVQGVICLINPKHKEAFVKALLGFMLAEEKLGAAEAISRFQGNAEKQEQIMQALEDGQAVSVHPTSLMLLTNPKRALNGKELISFAETPFTGDGSGIFPGVTHDKVVVDGRNYWQRRS